MASPAAPAAPAAPLSPSDLVLTIAGEAMLKGADGGQTCEIAGSDGSTPGRRTEITV